MAELAQYHTEWNNYIINSVLSDDSVLKVAVNMDKKTTIYEIVNTIKYFHAELNRRILDSTEVRKGDLWRELDNYISKDRTPPLTEQLYDTVIRSDAYKERLAKNEAPPEQESPVTDGVSSSTVSAPQTYSQLGNRSIQELLSGSAVSLSEVDAILRDGGNFDNYKYNTAPFSSRSTLRIAARFAKGKEPQELTAYLRYEYLRGRHNHPENPTGKCFDFGNHRVCAWYDESGIQLAIRCA